MNVMVHNLMAYNHQFLDLSPWSILNKRELIRRSRVFRKS